MIPLVSASQELAAMRDLTVRIAQEVQKKFQVQVEYTVGTMIELPRACVTSDEIAPLADFYSFGTNDLTQTVFGLSRDDSGNFLPFYEEHGILKVDPFTTIDIKGVGAFMQMAVEKGRKVKKNLKIGICGEQGGEPKSVEFCHLLKLDYVSCSPFRVPIARLAAAQSTIKEKMEKKKK
jgi:pyruvate,orthophosphate dikinase